MLRENNDPRKFLCFPLSETNEISQLAKILFEGAFSFLYTQQLWRLTKLGQDKQWWCATLIKIWLTYFSKLSDDPSHRVPVLRNHDLGFSVPPPLPFVIPFSTEHNQKLKFSDASFPPFMIT